MSKNIIIIAVALFVGVLVGFLFERQRAIDKMEAAKLSAQKMIDEQKMTIDKMMAENKAAMEKLQSITITPSPTGVMKKK